VAEVPARTKLPIWLMVANSGIAATSAGGSERSTTAGVHSVLSSPIDIPGDTGATLSLFGVRAEAFVAESETVGAMLVQPCRDCACPRHARAPVQGRVGYP
jgi:hypothetical protein